MPRLPALAVVCLLALASGSLEAASRKLRIRSVLHDPVKRHADLYVPMADGGRDFLYLAMEGVSEPQQVVLTDGMLQLFDSDAIDADKPLDGLVATARVPDSVQRAIVFLFPAGEDARLPYRLIVLNDDGRAFPKGETRVLNMTAQPLAMKAGEHNVQLPAAKISPVPPVKKVNHMNRAQTAFYRRGEDPTPWVLFAERPMQFTPTSRHLVIIYQLPGLKEPRLRTLVDTAPIALEAE